MAAAIGAGNLINMGNFVDGVAPPINIVTTGRIELVLAQTAGLSNNFGIEAEMKELLNCLSQTLSMQGQYKGKCESALKFRFMVLVKSDPLSASMALKGIFWRFDSNLSPLIEEVEKSLAKMEYMGKPWISRFIHHLKEKGSTDNLKLGVQILLVNGIFQVFISESNDKAQKVSIATAVAGGGLIATSLCHSAYKAYYKKF